MYMSVTTYVARYGESAGGGIQVDGSKQYDEESIDFVVSHADHGLLPPPPESLSKSLPSTEIPFFDPLDVDDDAFPDPAEMPPPFIEDKNPIFSNLHGPKGCIGAVHWDWSGGGDVDVEGKGGKSKANKKNKSEVKSKVTSSLIPPKSNWEVDASDDKHKDALPPNPVPGQPGDPYIPPHARAKVAKVNVPRKSHGAKKHRGSKAASGAKRKQEKAESEQQRKYVYVLLGSYMMTIIVSSSCVCIIRLGKVASLLAMVTRARKKLGDDSTNNEELNSYGIVKDLHGSRDPAVQGSTEDNRNISDGSNRRHSHNSNNDVNGGYQLPSISSMPSSHNPSENHSESALNQQFRLPPLSTLSKPSLSSFPPPVPIASLSAARAGSYAPTTSRNSSAGGKPQADSTFGGKLSITPDKLPPAAPKEYDKQLDKECEQLLAELKLSISQSKIGTQEQHGLPDHRRLSGGRNESEVSFFPLDEKASHQMHGGDEESTVNEGDGNSSYTNNSFDTESGAGTEEHGGGADSEEEEDDMDPYQNNYNATGDRHKHGYSYGGVQLHLEEEEDDEQEEEEERRLFEECEKLRTAISSKKSNYRAANDVFDPL